MKSILSDNPSGQIKRMAAPLFALFLSLAGPAWAQTRGLNAVSAGAVSSTSAVAPKGVKVLAQLPLDDQPVTRMFTQIENGRTYLYIEHGRRQFTAVDVTKKRNPQIINRAPGKVDAAQYQDLAEGGTVEATSPKVIAGFDNVGGRGMFSVLQANNPDDAPLLQAFADSSNLADRDRNLFFFASSTRLLIVEDGRWKGMDYTIN